MNKKSFRLCADDYALAPGVSAGILKAIHAGRLSGTSVLTTSAFWPSSALDLRGLPPYMEIGLHLNLTLGCSLGPMHYLCAEKEFPSLRLLCKRLFQSVVSGHLLQLRNEIRDEIARQLDAFEAHMGRLPDYIDGHQHVHGLPIIRYALIEELERRYMHHNLKNTPKFTDITKNLAEANNLDNPLPPSERRIWIRSSTDHFRRILARSVELAKAYAVSSINFGSAHLWQRYGYSTNEGFSGFSSFDPTRNYGDDFSHFLHALGSDHIVMCHPGYVDDELIKIDKAVESRDVELRFLLSDEFWERLDKAGACLAHQQEDKVYTYIPRSSP